MTRTSTNSERLENYVSAAEAARIVGLTKQGMSRLVRRGHFTTKIVAGRVLVLRSEAESFVARPKGRPIKKGQAETKPLKIPLEANARGNRDIYISQADAASIRGVTKQAIADLIRRGRLSATKVAGRMLVLRSEVEVFAPQPRTGRPPKRKSGAKPQAPNRSKK